MKHEIKPIIFGHDFHPNYPEGIPHDFKLYKDEKDAENHYVLTSEGKRYRDSQDSMQRVEEITEELIDILNRSGEDEVYFGVIRKLGRTHRTLQQLFMKNMVMAAIEFFAYEQEIDHTDLRNEATCKMATEIMKLVKEKNLYLPHF